MAKDQLTELALRAGKGDEVAMNELLPQVIIMAKSIVRRQLWYSSIEDKEDLAQDIMCRFLKSLPSFAGKATFSSWFARLASNTCVCNYHKRTAKRRQRPDNFEYDDSYFPNYNTALYCEQLIELCTTGQQRVMWLLYNGYSLDQVVAITGIGYEAVRSRQRNATKRIHRRLRQLKHGNSTNT